MENKNVRQIILSLPVEILAELEQFEFYDCLRFDSRNQKIVFLILKGLRAIKEEKK